MNITRYAEFEDLDQAMERGEPFLAVIFFDGQNACWGHIDECVEHHILLTKAGRDSREIDKCFRIVFSREGAEWTFICPPDYKGIADKTQRIAAFYKDGFATVSSFLAELGCFVDIHIPKRYRRHFDMLN